MLVTISAVRWRRLAAGLVRLLLSEAPQPRWLCYGWALAAGGIFVLSIFPRHLLLTGGVPNVELTGDMAAHVIGQRAFLQDGWHWPLLRTVLLNWPDGLSIAMTDSNPLVSLPLKLFRRDLPTGFSTVQLWLALCYLLQPVAAVFALRSAGERRFLPAFAMSLFAIAMPSFIYRHSHSALSAHFLLLLALGAYFRTTRHLRGRSWLGPLLLPVSLLVHPYLAFMVLALLTAAPLSLALAGERRWRRAAGSLGLAVVLTLAVSACLGYAAADPPGGFGFASMNAISPFFPVFSRYLGRHLHFVDATGMQYEGYQYLGTGLLPLAAIAVVTLFFSTRVLFLRRHVGLLLACLGLTALALSDVVYVGKYKLLDLEPVPSFMHQLRASGRVFWPVAYVVLLASVATAMRLLPLRAGRALLLGAALMQLLDSRDLRKAAARDLRAHRAMVLDETRLESLMATHRLLTVLPAYGCGADANAPAFLQLLLAASLHGVPANTMYVGRFASLPACGTTQTAESPLADGELRVFLASDARTGPAIVPGGADRCRMLNVVAVCSLQTAALAGLPPVVPPKLEIGRDIGVGSAMVAPILGTGWYLPEPDGTWTIEQEAAIVGEFASPPAVALTLRARMQGFTGVSGTPQTIVLSVNGHAGRSFDVADRVDTVLRLTIPRDQLTPDPLVLRFAIRAPARPSETHVNGDTRQLGIFLESLRFDPAPP